MSLAQFFPPSILPLDLGGSGPSVDEQCEEWTQHILQAEGYLQSLCVDLGGNSSESWWCHPHDDVLTERHTFTILQKGEFIEWLHLLFIEFIYSNKSLVF